MDYETDQIIDQISALACQIGAQLDFNIYHRGMPIALSGQVITNSLLRNLRVLDAAHIKFSKADVSAENGKPDVTTLVVEHLKGHSLELAMEAGVSQDLTEEVRSMATKKVAHLFESCRYLSTVDLDAAAELAADIVGMAINLNISAFKLEDLKDYDQYTYYHSVNCCVLATALFAEYSDNEQELLELGIGMLLHDIGKSKIELRILQKPSRLTEAEFAEIQRHTTYGYNLVKNNPKVSPLVKGIIQNHHEHVNGSGYMRALSESQLSIFEMIAGICDSFDAMTTSRPHRKRIEIHQAVSIMIRGSGIKYNTKLVNFFLRAIGRFPVGTFVVLNNSEIGIVQRLQSGGIALPLIKVIFDQHGSKLAEPHEIDLSTAEDIYIERAIDVA